MSGFANPVGDNGSGVLHSTPEQVVEEQLRYLQSGDIQSAFELNSCESQSETGPWKQYAKLLSEPPFSDLLRHEKGTVMMEMHHRDLYTASCLVYILPKMSSSRKKRKMMRAFLWELSIYTDDDVPGDDCWMVDSIVPDFEDTALDFDDFDAIFDDSEDPMFEF